MNLPSVPALQHTGPVVPDNFTKTRDRTFENGAKTISEFDLGIFSKSRWASFVGLRCIFYKINQAFELKFYRDFNEKRKIFDLILGIAFKRIFQLCTVRSFIDGVQSIEQKKMLALEKSVYSQYMLNLEKSLLSQGHLFWMLTQLWFVIENNIHSTQSRSSIFFRFLWLISKLYLSTRLKYELDMALKV